MCEAICLEQRDLRLLERALTRRHDAIPTDAPQFVEVRSVRALRHVEGLIRAELGAFFQYEGGDFLPPRCERERAPWRESVLARCGALGIVEAQQRCVRTVLGSEREDRRRSPRSDV